MNLQFTYKITDENGDVKSRTKTISNINQGVGTESYRQFSRAYNQLIEVQEFKAYLVNKEEL